MSEHPEPVVVGTDGSAGAERAVRWAADDAARTHRPLLIVHVVERRIYDGPASAIPGIRETLTERGLRILREAHDLALQEQPGLTVEEELAHDTTTYAGLHAHADDAYETVVGHRGLGGFTGLLLGSAGLRLAGHQAGPVVIVRGDEDAPAGEVVVGLDLKEPAEPILDYAFAAAARLHVRLHAVHAWHPAPLSLETDIDLDAADAMFRDHLSSALAPWRSRHPDVKVIEEVVRGHPTDALVGASAHADLVVVGHRTHKGPHLGSVSHGAIHHAHCPVAVVRPRDHSHEASVGYG
ncbi:universal stress protein [Spirillospora sp. NPDC048911]|uniref:universal stress protein n=1 Tax=Spirillospora sp. NPDC048911 TaxID=3364527 RepID=UPI003724AE24